MRVYQRRSQIPRVAGTIPAGGKRFAEFILLFTTKQYKNANIAKLCVITEKRRLGSFLDTFKCDVYIQIIHNDK